MNVPPSPRRIDVHHHLIPPAFVQAMNDAGITRVAGAPLPKWSAGLSIDVMDANGIRTSLMSLSAPGVYFGNVEKACRLARECNEFARGHTLALFPRYAEAGDGVRAAPVHGGEGLRSRLRRLAMRPILGIADRARNR